MKINFIVKDMVAKLQTMFAITKSVERSILENVLLKADDKTTINATDGRFIQGRVKVGSKIEKPGATLIPIEVLNFMKALKGTDQGATLEVDGSTVRVAIGESEATFSVRDKAQYPQLLAWGQVTHTLETKPFVLAAKTLQAVAGKDFDTIYMDTGNGTLLMGATDNFRIAFFELPCELDIKRKAIKAEVLTPLASMSGEDNIQLGIDNGRHKIVFGCADYWYMVSTTVIDDRYDVLKFWEDVSGKTFNLAELVGKVKAASAVLGPNEDAIKLDLSGAISAVSSRVTYEDTFMCQPQDAEFSLNAKHLTDALRMPYEDAVMGVKLLGSRELLCVRDETKQMYLVPLEDT